MIVKIKFLKKFYSMVIFKFNIVKNNYWLRVKFLSGLREKIENEVVYVFN